MPTPAGSDTKRTLPPLIVTTSGRLWPPSTALPTATQGPVRGHDTPFNSLYEGLGSGLGSTDHARPSKTRINVRVVPTWFALLPTAMQAFGPVQATLIR
jgi:hypothetical protein